MKWVWKEVAVTRAAVGAYEVALVRRAMATQKVAAVRRAVATQDVAAVELVAALVTAKPVATAKQEATACTATQLRVCMRRHHCRRPCAYIA